MWKPMSESMAHLDVFSIKAQSFIHPQVVSVLTASPTSRRAMRMGILSSEGDWRTGLADLTGGSRMVRALNRRNNSATPGDGSREQRVLRNKSVFLKPSR